MAREKKRIYRMKLNSATARVEHCDRKPVYKMPDYDVNVNEKVSHLMVNF